MSYSEVNFVNGIMLLGRSSHLPEFLMSYSEVNFVNGIMLSGKGSPKSLQWKGAKYAYCSGVIQQDFPGDRYVFFVCFIVLVWQ